MLTGVDACQAEGCGNLRQEQRNCCVERTLPSLDLDTPQLTHPRPVQDERLQDHCREGLSLLRDP